MQFWSLKCNWFLWIVVYTHKNGFTDTWWCTQKHESTFNLIRLPRSALYPSTFSNWHQIPYCEIRHSHVTLSLGIWCIVTYCVSSDARGTMSAYLFEDISCLGHTWHAYLFFLCGQLILLIVRHIDIRWNEKHKYQKIIQIDQQITKLDIVCFFFVLVNV